MPIRTRSSTVHPCSVALWPMVTSQPTGSGMPGPARKTHPSCTLLRADHDGITVGAQHRPVPHARLRADPDASDEHGTGGDEGSPGDIGAILAEREQWRRAGAGAGRRLAAGGPGWPITRRAVPAAQHAQPEWAQVAAHVHAAGHHRSSQPAGQSVRGRRIICLPWLGAPTCRSVQRLPSGRRIDGVRYLRPLAAAVDHGWRGTAAPRASAGALAGLWCHRTASAEGEGCQLPA